MPSFGKQITREPDNTHQPPFKISKPYARSCNQVSGIEYVRLTSTYGNMEDKIPFIFTNVQDGTLSGYSTDTGFFTVPSNGIYNIVSTFTVNLSDSQSANFVQIYLLSAMKNYTLQSSYISQASSSAIDSRVQLHINWTGNLSKNDEVHIELDASGEEVRFFVGDTQQLTITRLS